MEAQKTVQTKLNTEVTIAGVTFKNPVMTASGTFGSGMEYGEFVDLNKLGAVVTKGVANVRRFKSPWSRNDKGRGKCAVAGQSHTESDRDLWRHVKCHRSAKSRNRCFY